MADINESALKTEIQSLAGSDKHMYTVVDVRSSQSVDSWIKSTVEKMGKLDGAVNMAGVISPAKPITEETDESWNFNFDVNARGVFFCLRAQLRAMGLGGSIVCSRGSCQSVMTTDSLNRSLPRVSSGRWALRAWRHTVPVKLR